MKIIKLVILNVLEALLIGTLLFALFTCKQVSKIKIGFMVPTYEISRYEKDRDFFVSKVTELGGEVVVTDAGGDDKKQITQANELISQGVSVLVVSAVNQNTAAAIIREAHDNNIKVIAYERLIQNCDLDYYITFDSKAVGQKMAQYVLKYKPEGNYILLGGDKSDKNAMLVKEGQKEEIDSYVKSGKIKIIFDVYIEGWSSENAYMTIKDVLKLSDIMPDVILSSNDGMAEGAVKALTEFGLEGKVMVTGQDAELSACRRIIEGTQNVTIYKPFKKQGETAAIVAMKVAKGEQVIEINTKVPNGRTEVPSILLEPITVDKSNLENTVIADGFYKESDIFKK